MIPNEPEEPVSSFAGFMPGSAVIPEGLDLTASIDGATFDAEVRILHR